MSPKGHLPARVPLGFHQLAQCLLPDSRRKPEKNKCLQVKNMLECTKNTERIQREEAPLQETQKTRNRAYKTKLYATHNTSSSSISKSKSARCRNMKGMKNVVYIYDNGRRVGTLVSGLMSVETFIRHAKRIIKKVTTSTLRSLTTRQTAVNTYKI